MRFYSFICAFLITLISFGQDNTSGWSVKWSKPEVKQGEEVELIISCAIKDNWYMYASDFDPNLGPVVTELELAKHTCYSSVGSLISYKRKEKYDSLWMGKITYFTGKAEFRIKLKILCENPLIKGTLRYQVCSDLEGRCIPGSFDLAAPALKVTGSSAKTQETPAIKTTPAASSGADSEKIAALEKEKVKTDASIPYLKNFIQKYRTK